MNKTAWIALGWFFMVLWSAAATRIGWGHFVPNAALITVAFLGLRGEPKTVVLVALILGYLSGRAAGAPVGLHALTLGVTGMMTYTISGHLKGDGAAFFALSVGAATIFHDMLLYLLATWIGHGAAFASTTYALLFPSAIMNALVALIAAPLMFRVEKTLQTEKREGLSWS